MISDKLSVGPSQFPGEIDRLNVQSKDFFNDKKEFEVVLDKKDKEVRETSGGTNRKMLERKIDKNPKRLSEETEKDEKEQNPTSNTMAFQQSRVEVVDSDKNPETMTKSSDSEISAPIANQKLELNQETAPTAEMNPLQDEGDPLLKQLAAGLTTESAIAANAETSAMVSEEAMNPFQANVFQQLQQSQQEIKALAQESALSTKDLSEALESELGQGTTSEGIGQKLNADQIQAQLAKTMEHAGQNAQNQQFTQQQFDQSFAMSPSQEKIDGASAETHEDFKLDDKPVDALNAPSVSSHGLPTHAVGQNTFQAAGSMAALGIDKPSNPLNAQNTNEIVKQAEFLVKDGGGTAKIRMTPEGMGTVDLRVTMQDGKVQVELNTADPQAKKLLQDSITDLRSSLASHNFNLDHVKINNMSAMADLSQQNSNSQSFLNQHHSGQNQNWNQFEGNSEQQSGRQGPPSQDTEARANYFRSEQTLQTESRQQAFAAPRITRGYGIATKSTSSMNMVA